MQENGGEWLIDEKTGERYRYIGNGCREYAPVRVKVSNGHEQRPEAPAPYCVFEKVAHCSGKACAFYSDGGCMIEWLHTEGRRCPLNTRICSPACKMYDGGCGFIKRLNK